MSRKSKEKEIVLYNFAVSFVNNDMVDHLTGKLT